MVEPHIAPDDPVRMFFNWFQEAKAGESIEPEAAALATVDSHGMPNVRMVLVKAFDANGLVFYTNLESAKGKELTENPKAAACFNWKSIRRQVRVRGLVESVDVSEADAYFSSRSRDSKIGAWASKQSRELSNREELEQAVGRIDKQYPGEDVPRPPHWSGYRLRPLEIEFWQNRPSRLHERVQFQRNDPNGLWRKTLLYP